MTTTQRKEQDRRRRKSATQTAGRLGINPELLDFKKYAYRFINDEPGRLVVKTKHDDWDVISNSGEKEDSTDMGDAVSIVVGTMPDGSPKRAYLCRKLKKFYEDDKAAEMAALDEQVNQLRRGNDRDGSTQSDYVPQSGIKFQ